MLVERESEYSVSTSTMEVSMANMKRGLREMIEFIAIIIVFYLFLLWFAFVVFSIPPIL